MTNEQILEGNKLIAEFLQFPLGVGTETSPIIYINVPQWYGRESTVSLERLLFNKDWNLLMQAVGRIENTKAEEGMYFDVDILSTGVIISSVSNHVVQITQEEIQSTSKIEAVYNAVISFIKWYNENK